MAKVTFSILRNALRSASTDFYETDIFPGTFIVFCLILFTEVLIKDLARMLIHVRKIFNCRVYYKIMLSMCLVIVEKELWTWLWSSTSQNATFEKNYQRRKSFSSRCLFLSLVLIKTNKNEHAESHDNFIPFKSQIPGSHISILFETWTLVFFPISELTQIFFS